MTYFEKYYVTGSEEKEGLDISVCGILGHCAYFVH